MKETKEKTCWIIPFLIVDGIIKFLIVKHNLWHWWFPKWHIEKWETELQAAKRELMEETGIVNVKINDESGFIEEYTIILNWIKIKKTVILFLWEIHIDNINEIHILDSELNDYLIDNYDNISKLLTHDSSKILLKRVFYSLTHKTNGRC